MNLHLHSLTCLHDVHKENFTFYVFHAINFNGIKKKRIRHITGPRCLEGSRKLKFPDYVTMAQDGGKVVSLTGRFYPQKILLVLISVRG